MVASLILQFKDLAFKISTNHSFIHSFIHCRHLYSVSSSSGSTQKCSQHRQIMLF